MALCLFWTWHLWRLHDTPGLLCLLLIYGLFGNFILVAQRPHNLRHSPPKTKEERPQARRLAYPVKSALLAVSLSSMKPQPLAMHLLMMLFFQGSLRRYWPTMPQPVAPGP